MVNLSYNLDLVRSAYISQFKQPGVYRYVRELWSDYLIVAIEAERGDSPIKFIKVPFSVGKDNSITFGAETEVKQAFVELSHGAGDAYLEKAGLVPCTEKVNRSLLETVALANKLKMEESQLMKLSASVRNLL